MNPRPKKSRPWAKWLHLSWFLSTLGLVFGVAISDSVRVLQTSPGWVCALLVLMWSVMPQWLFATPLENRYRRVWHQMLALTQLPLAFILQALTLGHLVPLMSLTSFVSYVISIFSVIPLTGILVRKYGWRSASPHIVTHFIINLLISMLVPILFAMKPIDSTSYPGD